MEHDRKTADNTTSAIALLPDDLLSHLLAEICNLKSLVRLRQVSKRFHKLIDTHFIWKRYYSRKHNGHQSYIEIAKNKYQFGLSAAKAKAPDYATFLQRESFISIYVFIKHTGIPVLTLIPLIPEQYLYDREILSTLLNKSPQAISMLPKLFKYLNILTYLVQKKHSIYAYLPENTRLELGGEIALLVIGTQQKALPLELLFSLPFLEKAIQLDSDNYWKLRNQQIAVLKDTPDQYAFSKEQEKKMLGFALHSGTVFQEKDITHLEEVLLQSTELELPQLFDLAFLKQEIKADIQNYRKLATLQEEIRQKTPELYTLDELTEQQMLTFALDCYQSLGNDDIETFLLNTLQKSPILSRRINPTKELVIKAMAPAKPNPSYIPIYRYISKELAADPDVAFQALLSEYAGSRTQALSHFPESLQVDMNFLIRLVRELRLFSPSMLLKLDAEHTKILLIEAARYQGKTALMHVPPDADYIKEITLVAATHQLNMWDYKGDLQYDPDILTALVRLNGLRLKQIPSEYLTAQIIQAAIEQNGLAIEHVAAEHLTKDLALIAVSQNGNAYYLLPNKYKSDPKIYETSVRHCLSLDLKKASPRNRIILEMASPLDYFIDLALHIIPGSLLPLMACASLEYLKLLDEPTQKKVQSICMIGSLSYLTIQYYQNFPSADTKQKTP